MQYKCKQSFSSKTGNYYHYGEVISEMEHFKLPWPEGDNFKKEYSSREELDLEFESRKKELDEEV